MSTQARNRSAAARQRPGRTRSTTTKAADEPPAAHLARRKTPIQKRAQTTVESIFEATEELIREHGFADVGTRAIAERAGVSVGSLYQYFPTYESILLAWYETVAASAVRTMKLATISVLDKPLEESARIALGALLDVFEEHELVLIRMPNEVPEIARATSITSFEYLNRSAMRIYFAQHHEFNPRDTERHIFFLDSIVMSILRRYVSEKPRYLTRTAVINQVTRFIIAYLMGSLAP